VQNARHSLQLPAYPYTFFFARVPPDLTGRKHRAINQEAGLNLYSRPIHDRI
jgi:hypothetical protein